jgi:hypothetical protein
VFVTLLITGIPAAAGRVGTKLEPFWCGATPVDAKHEGRADQVLRRRRRVHALRSRDHFLSTLGAQPLGFMLFTFFVFAFLLVLILLYVYQSRLLDAVTD